MLRMIQSCNIQIALDSFMRLFFKYLEIDSQQSKNDQIYLVLLCVNRYIKTFNDKKEEINLPVILGQIRSYLEQLQDYDQSESTQNAFKLFQLLLKNICQHFDHKQVFLAFEQISHNINRNED